MDTPMFTTHIQVITFTQLVFNYGNKFRVAEPIPEIET